MYGHSYSGKTKFFLLPKIAIGVAFYANETVTVKNLYDFHLVLILSICYSTQTTITMTTNHKLSPRIQVLMAAFIVLLISCPLYSQTYSQEEQGLIDHITNCWDAWMEGVEKNNPEIWYEKCPAKPDASFWWTEHGAPEQIDALRRNWDLDRAFAGSSYWLDMRPVAIRIWDDVGMVQFYGYWLTDTEDGKVNTEYKRTEVFKNENGKWILLGGQGTPVTQADAEPYR
jgi:hypothetical protein